MTPEQKANDLIDKMHGEHVLAKNRLRVAKKCARILCDEVIQSWKRMFGKDEESHPEIMYWKKVKEEIEKA